MEKYFNGSENSSSTTFIEADDYDLQFPTWSMEYLKQAAVEQRLARPHSLAWAVLLNAVPPPSGDILLSLQGHRNFYDDLRKKLSMDPRSVVGDDPLSQNDESAWKQHFCDNELKALILQDVVRTFPDEEYFRDKDVQDMMVRVLFFWARAHARPGYRQGMHEILAPALLQLHCDRQRAPTHVSDTLRYYLQEEFLEHDSYMLFSAIMRGLEKYYTTGDVVPSSCGRLPLSKTLHNHNEVVRYLDELRKEYLLNLDLELATHLADCNISMELFGIRWLRLLFGREFPRSEIPGLWGFIFSDGPMLPNVHYVILAMLISMRTILLGADTGTALSILMRPSVVSARHVMALALHLRAPRRHARPAPPALAPPTLAPPTLATDHGAISESSAESYTMPLCSEDARRVCSVRSACSVCSVRSVRSACSVCSVRSVRSACSVCSVRSVRSACSACSARSACCACSACAAASGPVSLALRALPGAAAALSAALPAPPPAASQPLRQILQLAALLQCRDRALTDVETALEAAENQLPSTDIARRPLPVAVVNKKVNAPNKQTKPVKNLKEVQLKVFHQGECAASDLPFLDPLRLRTE